MTWKCCEGRMLVNTSAFSVCVCAGEVGGWESRLWAIPMLSCDEQPDNKAKPACESAMRAEARSWNWCLFLCDGHADLSGSSGCPRTHTHTHTNLTFYTTLYLNIWLLYQRPAEPRLELPSLTLSEQPTQTWVGKLICCFVVSAAPSELTQLS